MLLILKKKQNFYYNLNSQPFIIPIIKIFLYFNFFNMTLIDNNPSNKNNN